MKEELKIFESILPRNPVKAELSNIFMDKEYIVATDTRIMIRKKHTFSVEKSCLIVNDKARWTISPEGLFEGMAVNHTRASGYPDTARLYKKFNGQERLKRAERQDFISALYIAAEEGHVIDFVLYAPALKKIAKLLKDEETREVRIGEDMPIYMTIGEYELLLMPMIFPK